MELGVYQRKTGSAADKPERKSRIKEIKNRINIGKILYHTLLFMVSRATILGYMTPFGAAMFAVEHNGKIPYLAGALALTAAAVPYFEPLTIFKYAAAMIIFSVVAAKLDMRKNPLLKGAVMGGAVFISSLVPQLAAGVVLYDIMLFVLEAIMAFTGVYLFSRAKTMIFTGSIRDGAGSNDIVSIVAITGVAIMGAGRLEVLGMSVSGCLCVLFALLFACGNGTVIGAASGVTMGLIYGLYSGNLTAALGSFALASMLTGFFSRYGRAGAALSFLLANSVITFYAVGTSGAYGAGGAFLNISEIATASLIFTLLPQKIADYFSLTGEKKRSQAAKMKEFTYLNIMENAQAIESIADTFSSIAEKRLLGTEIAASSFFEKTARKLCDGCSLKKHCWRSEFHRTYTAFFVMLEVCGKKGCVDYCDIPEELVKKCVKKEKLTAVFNAMYEVYKVDRLWESRVSESRTMVAKQLSCLSDRMKKLAKGTRAGAAFDVSCENDIRAALNENKIPASEVLVTTGVKGGTRIDVTLKNPMNTEYEKMETIISKCMGDRFINLSRIENKVRFSKAPPLRVQVGRAREAKDQNPYNGDSTECVYLDENRFAMVLSDGMGSGERASSDSSAAVDITKKMLQSGFDVDTTISMVNSVLVLKSAETSFATMDLAVMDLKESEIQFLKLGASLSFIKRGEKVKMVASSSLPAGVFSRTDIDREKSSLKSGDTVVMISDGVLGNHDGEALKEAISNYMGTNPQEMAGRILSCAKDLQANIVSDDMTVMVAMVEEEIA